MKITRTVINRRRGVGLLAVVLICLLAVAMAAATPTFAATQASGPDAREKASSNVATLKLGKVLIANHAEKFPATLQSVQYQLTAVKGFDNANVKSNESGKAIAAKDMPMPKSQDAENHQVKVSGTTATVTVGDFRTDEKDSDTQKHRVTPVEISFHKAGYYLYRLTETGSTPENVPGVTYDNHSYYVVIYVANRTDEAGNTLDDVYVHDITSYRNESGKDTYQPNLSDIVGVTDNKGNAASENTEEDLAKVGLSDPKHPNELEAYRFWNHGNTQDIVLQKNVTGNLGDRSKEFEFKVSLAGLEPGTSYTTSEAAADTKATTSAGTDLVRAEKGTLSGKSFVSDDQGCVELLVRLQDDEKLVLNGIPVSAKYQITEEANDHIAAFQVKGSGGTPEIQTTSGKNEDPNQALSTAEERVDLEDGTVTVTFTNHRNLAAVTGTPEMMGPAALLLIAFAGIMASRRRRYE